MHCMRMRQSYQQNLVSGLVGHFYNNYESTMTRAIVAIRPSISRCIIAIISMISTDICSENMEEDELKDSALSLFHGSKYKCDQKTEL